MTRWSRWGRLRLGCHRSCASERGACRVPPALCAACAPCTQPSSAPLPLPARPLGRCRASTSAAWRRACASAACATTARRRGSPTPRCTAWALPGCCAPSRPLACPRPCWQKRSAAQTPTSAQVRLRRRPRFRLGRAMDVAVAGEQAGRHAGQPASGPLILKHLPQWQPAAFSAAHAACLAPTPTLASLLPQPRGGQGGLAHGVCGGRSGGLDPGLCQRPRRRPLCGGGARPRHRQGACRGARF